MRIFKDLDLVEQLGSGVPRIIENYHKSCFRFSDNFLRVIFPSSEVVSSNAPQVTPQVRKLVNVLSGELSRSEIQILLNLLDRENFRINYLLPAIEDEFIELTIPNKPQSSKQQYRLTPKGKELKNELNFKE